MTSKGRGGKTRSGAGARSGKLRIKKETLKDLDAKNGQKIRGGGKRISIPVGACISHTCFTCGCPIIGS